jgi:hypothetical protein
MSPATVGPVTLIENVPVWVFHIPVLAKAELVSWFTDSALVDGVIEPLRPATVRVVMQEGIFVKGKLLLREMWIIFSSTGNGEL